MVYICPNCCSVHYRGIQDCEESKEAWNKVQEKKNEEDRELVKEAQEHEKHCLCNTPIPHVKYLKQVRELTEEEKKKVNEMKRHYYKNLTNDDVEEHRKHCPLCPNPKTHMAGIRALKSIIEKRPKKEEKIMIT